MPYNYFVKVTVLGPQGSGKSTHALFLAQKLNVPFVDMGDLIRNACSTETPENQMACKLMKKGSLVPFEFASNTLRDRVRQKDCLGGFVLDGYPRTIEHLDIFNPNPDIVIYINVPTDMCIQRLLVRGRPDDNEKSIMRRLDWFFKNSEKVLHYYADQKKLYVVDGTGPFEQTFRQIEAIVLK